MCTKNSFVKNCVLRLYIYIYMKKEEIGKMKTRDVRYPRAG